MERSTLSWLGHLGFIIFLLIGYWGMRKWRKLQQRYIGAIARTTGYRVASFYDSPLGLPNIYARGSPARRLQRAYLRAFRRHVVVLSGLLLLWLFFGGWLLVTLADSAMAVWPLG